MTKADVQLAFDRGYVKALAESIRESAKLTAQAYS
jgi:hypothetical protein